MEHNIIYATILGKVSVKRGPDAWVLTTWERPPGRSWKSMRKMEEETYPFDAYPQARMQALSYYEEILHRTKKWAQKEQGVAK